MLGRVTFVAIHSIPINEVLFFLHLLTAGAILLLFARLGRPWLVALVVVCTLLINIAVAKSTTRVSRTGPVAPRRAWHGLR